MAALDFTWVNSSAQKYHRFFNYETSFFAKYFVLGCSFFYWWVEPHSFNLLFSIFTDFIGASDGDELDISEFFRIA